MDVYAQCTSAGKFTTESRTSAENTDACETTKEVNNFWSVNMMMTLNIMMIFHQHSKVERGGCFQQNIFLCMFVYQYDDF